MRHLAVPTYLRLIAAVGAALMAVATMVAVSGPALASGDVPEVGTEVLVSGTEADNQARPAQLAVDELGGEAFIVMAPPYSNEAPVLYYGEDFSQTRELSDSCDHLRIVSRAVECFLDDTGLVQVETYAGDLIYQAGSSSRIMNHPTGWVEWRINFADSKREVVNVTIDPTTHDVSDSTLFDHIQYPATNAVVQAHYSSPYVSYARIALSGTSQAGIFELIVWDGDFDDYHWHFMPGGEPVVGTYAEGLLRSGQSGAASTLTHITHAGEQFSVDLPEAFDTMGVFGYVDAGGTLARLAHQGWWELSGADEFAPATNAWWTHDYLLNMSEPGFIAPYRDGYLATINGVVTEVDAHGPVGAPLATVPRAPMRIQVVGVDEGTAYWLDNSQSAHAMTAWSYDLATGGPAVAVADEVLYSDFGPTAAFGDGQLWVMQHTDSPSGTYRLVDILRDGPQPDLEVAVPLLFAGMTDTHVVMESACMFALGAAADLCGDDAVSGIAIDRVTGQLSLEPDADRLIAPFAMEKIDAGGLEAIEVTARATGTTVFTSPYYNQANWYNTWTNTMVYRAQEQGLWSVCVGHLDGQNAPPACAEVDKFPRLISDDLVALYSNDVDGFDLYSTDTMEHVTSVSFDESYGHFSGDSQPIETEGFVMFTTYAQAASGPTSASLHLARYEAPGAVQWFSDVGPGHPFFVEIDWLARQGITGGYSDGTFRPGAHVSRQAMAAFLYRVAGEPEFVAPATASFPDVPTSHDFFTEIEWLVAEGITTGYGDGTFRGGAHVSRQAMAAFLARFAGGDLTSAPATASFPDVPTSHTFFAEIEWLVAEGITTGYGDGTFRGGAHVSRQAMAAFLMRLDAAL